MDKTLDHRTPGQSDRAAGVLLAAAVGDALGVPYEFAPRIDHAPEMIGGGLGPYAPGENSDDTQMAVCVAEVAATGADLTTADALDAIADRFLAWRSHGATDIGITTSAALRGVTPGRGSAQRLTDNAARVLKMTGSAAGNGGLMRTGVIALTALDDRGKVAEASRAVCALTHADPLAAESCILWSEAIRVAVTEARFDLVGGLDLLPEESRSRWATWIDEATGADPASFGRNGFTVTALQAAWAAITSTLEVPRTFPCDHLRDGLFAAVQAGHDTDTVAAIAGSLLGARWGASAVPARYRRLVNGWPGVEAADLVRLAVLAARGGKPSRSGWPTAPDHAYSGWSAPMAVPHPFDSGVLLGTVNTPDHGCDAVVSLCRRGAVRQQGIARENQIDVWLVDDGDPAFDPNLDFVLDDAARAVEELRAEGKTVFVHCVAAQHRTPAVAVAYSRLLGHGPQDDPAIERAVGSERNGLLWNTAFKILPAQGPCR
ncbi:ADP-ribosylglycohydrolase family protein [Tessaracoccus palaemonis]|uniref:ADP-ribosylglycohydrolase family protein n=1 Tax=Tessaracoccus palaemonis TaxID=2829499 RepID=A0ABX8SGQ3_9ACTN|nr:ADP-ribosylglycohydrolase family protein [Tessaracoccus palaemonis]QXT61620.1 ADP-ribosylglycohydrolase family protein [Tessaracoccus palaemonis]